MSAVAADDRFRIPPLRREGRFVAGVAGGIADAIGVDAVVIRAAFVVLAAAGGIGVALYAIAWVLMASAGEVGDDAAPEPPAAGATERILGVTLVVVGALLLIGALGLGFDDRVAWPVWLVGLGLLVAWHRRRLGAFVDGGRSALVRVVAGLLLVVAGLAGLIALNLDLGDARDTLLLSAAVAAGLALVAAPAIIALARDLAEERRQRVLTEERERVAAHLHDSVLQTLALVQREADDPARTRALARRQERELRSWLYGSADDRAAGGVRAALERACAEVEELHEVPVELVVVGDLPVDDRVHELVAAAREGMVNAAKHSGAARIDVYAEVDDATTAVFVRDTGSGFEADAVPTDRRGLRDSVTARIERVGGTVSVRTTPGEGTEVELRLPRVEGH